MKILNQTQAPALQPLTGKLTIRFVQSRCCCQVYMGGCYMIGASGDSPMCALEEFRRRYDVPVGTKIKVLGFRETETIMVD